MINQLFIHISFVQGAEQENSSWFVKRTYKDSRQSDWALCNGEFSSDRTFSRFAVFLN